MKLRLSPLVASLFVACTSSPAPKAPSPTPSSPVASAPVTSAALPEPSAVLSSEPPPLPSTAPSSTPLPTRLVVSIADELPFLATASRNQRRVHGAPQSGTQTAPKTTKKAPKPGRTRTSRGNHPDPGVIVDIGTVSGASQAELQKQLRARGYTPFRACYEEGLRRNQQLTGRVSVEFTLGAEGTAQNAFKASSTLADESVNQCVVRETTLIALPRPQTGTPTVPMQVTFAVGDAPVRVPRPVNHADKLRETLRTKWAAVEACYQTGLERRKNLGGRLELRLRLKGTDIVEANEADTHFADADVSRCVATSYRSLKVAKVAKGEISVIYPLHLETIALRPTSQ